MSFLAKFKIILRDLSRLVSLNFKKQEHKHFLKFKFWTTNFRNSKNLKN